MQRREKNVTKGRQHTNKKGGGVKPRIGGRHAGGRAEEGGAKARAGINAGSRAGGAQRGRRTWARQGA